MRVPLEWLHEYCAPDLDVFALAERLAMTGTEVERVETHGVSGLEHFVVGKVLDARQHPDADRLRVCQVDTGDGECSQIVCGAPNVATGQTVAVARPGAVMPTGVRLKVAKLRGQLSNGMILAEDEVAIGIDHDGIMVLSDGLAAGTPLTEVLPLSTDVLVLEITPNRPDCLAVYGIAREAHAATGAPLAAPPWTRDPGVPGPVADARVTVECPDLCPRFTARVFEDVTVGPSPAWLKARLMAAGQRPISNVVDVTNYVMLLIGQPLHAFDLDRVAGGELVVRRARDGETVRTLDGQARTLTSDMVLIADDDGPTSIAGVMGGARSEVSQATTRVLMEVATWDGANVHRTSLALGLRSEASGRNEKGLAPEQAMDAQVLATQLMIEVCGARVAPGTIDVGYSEPTRPAAAIRLRDARVSGLLGVEVPRSRSAEILTALQFTVADAADGLDVTVPAFRRADVTREADLIEEVSRLGALQDLPASLPSRRGASGRLTDRQRLRRHAADALTAQGLHEIIGWSFESPETAERLRLRDRFPIDLRNPMSAEQARLRTTLLGSLLDVAQRNRARGAAVVRLFEAGAVYAMRDDVPVEPYHIAALLIGPVRPPTWRDGAPPAADVFAAKGVLAGLLDAVRLPWTVRAADPPEPFLHPGRAARVDLGDRDAGWLGEIHPSVAALWDLTDPVAALELDLEDAAELLAVPRYRDLTSFPAVREDLAVIVADGVTAAEVIAIVREAGGALLTGAEVFDVYRDEQRIGVGNVSLALRLQFQASDRTLTDAEVATRRRKIAAALTDRLRGRVRDS
ncbi:MAG: phenylalanine--tRNA ligase subunit beta [Solirubrobacterales bacterium]|nr:phenylalanine--tRNA ligase subunit beta [Solirubrobacterales bacterium]